MGRRPCRLERFFHSGRGARFHIASCGMTRERRPLLLAAGLLLAVSLAACSASTPPSRTTTNTVRWNAQPLNNARIVSLTGVSCPTGNDCWAVGSASSDSGVVVATTDGGTSWSTQTLPSTVTQNPPGSRIVRLSSISCPTSNNCWAVGATSTSSGVVVATTNGGKTWRIQFTSSGLSGTDVGGLYTLNGIWCPTSSNCWSVGGTSSNSGVVIATSDGGGTWKPQNLPGGVSTLSSVSCSTSSQCSATGASSSRVGVVVSTTDGGATWGLEMLPSAITQALPSGHYGLNGVSCLTKSCVAVGATSSNSGVVLSTMDGGTTWSAPTLPGAAGLLNGVSCPTRSDCVAVGATPSKSGLVIATSDGGTGWNSQTLPQGLGILYGISCQTEGECWVVGTTTSNRAVVLKTAAGT